MHSIHIITNALGQLSAVLIPNRLTRDQMATVNALAPHLASDAKLARAWTLWGVLVHPDYRAPKTKPTGTPLLFTSQT
jgi:hypothetical protein